MDFGRQYLCTYQFVLGENMVGFLNHAQALMIERCLGPILPFARDR